MIHTEYLDLAAGLKRINEKSTIERFCLFEIPVYPYFDERERAKVGFFFFESFYPFSDSWTK
jgi:hypothetical protein